MKFQYLIYVGFLVVLLVLFGIEVDHTQAIAQLR